jgi:preprotein translocase subunit SecE
MLGVRVPPGVPLSVNTSQRMKFLEYIKTFLEYIKINDSWVSTGIVYAILILLLVLLIRNLAKVSGFIGEVKGELRKASWPWDSDPKARGFKKYKELIDSTIVVLIAVILLAGFVQFWDFLQVYVVGFLTKISI